MIRSIINILSCSIAVMAQDLTLHAVVNHTFSANLMQDGHSGHG